MTTSTRRSRGVPRAPDALASGSSCARSAATPSSVCIILVVLIIGGGLRAGQPRPGRGDPAERARPSSASCSACCSVAHVVDPPAGAPTPTRRCCPLAGLLNGLGFVFIARLNETLAWQQATWTAVGIGAFCVTLMVVRRARNLDALPLDVRAARHRSC